MDRLKEIVLAFSVLTENRYEYLLAHHQQITKINIEFSLSQIHHLMGLQHLRDLAKIPFLPGRVFARQVLADRIT